MQQEDQIMFIAKCRSSFKFFAENAIDQNIKLEPFHQEWVDLVEHNRNVAITAFTGSGKCVTKDTQVPLANGTWKQITEINPGDRVVSLDTKTNKLVPGRVTQMYENGIKEVYKVTTRNGREIEVTSNHPFYTINGWKSIEGGLQKEEYVANRRMPSRTSFLKLGSSLKKWASSDIFWDKIIKIEYVGKKPTYDFEVLKYHSFIGNGYVLHNSTVLGICYILWKAFFTPKWEALIISSSMTQSKMLLERIKDFISESETLRILKPEDREKTWSAIQINLTNRVKIHVRPYNAEKHTVKGLHVDFILVDEAAECQPAEIFDRFVMTRAQRKKGKVVAISTPLSEIDLMQKMKERKNFVCKTYAAVTPDGKAIYPTVFDEKTLEDIKNSIGISAFEREYLCKPIAVEESLYAPNDVLDCFDKSKSLNSEPEKNELYFLGVDFAVSKKGDYSVFTTLAKKPDGTVIVKQLDRMRGMNLDAQEQHIEYLHSLFNYEKIVMDETQFGQSILQNLRNKYLPVRGQNFESRNRTDLLMNLKRLVESKLLIIPYNPDSERTQMLVDQLYKELTAFGKGKTATGRETYMSSAAHDDMVVSLAMAAKEITSQREVLDDIAF